MVVLYIVRILHCRVVAFGVICYSFGESDQLKVNKLAFSLVLFQLIYKIKWII